MRARATTRGAAALVALVVLLSTIVAVGAVPQPDDTIGLDQTANPTTVDPGDIIAFEATINATGYNAPAMAVDVPPGWSVENDSADGDPTYKENTAEWIWTEGGEYTVNFTVQVAGSASAGDFTIATNGSAIDPDDDSRVTNAMASTVTVESSSGSSVSRSTPPAVSTPNSTPTPEPSTTTPTASPTATQPSPVPTLSPTPTATAAETVSAPSFTSTPTDTGSSGLTDAESQIAIALLIGTVFAGLIGWRLRS